MGAAMTDKTLLRVWRAGRVMRWHGNPHLCGTSDPDDGHAARVTLMALWLKPDLSRDALIRALTHDHGEHATGDFSYEIKRNNPVMAGDIAKMEQAAILSLGFDQPEISDDEMKLIKICDWLDAWLWMVHHTPHLRKRKDWVDQANMAFGAAMSIGVEKAVAIAMREIEVEHND